jgi:hypothetical protein
MDVPYNEIADVLYDATGVIVPTAALQALLADRHALLGEVLEWGAGDTVVRENLADLVTTELVGGTCPTYGDVHAGFDADMFYASVEAAALDRGWKTVRA